MEHKHIWLLCKVQKHTFEAVWRYKVSCIHFTFIIMAIYQCKNNESSSVSNKIMIRIFFMAHFFKLLKWCYVLEIHISCWASVKGFVRLSTILGSFQILPEQARGVSTHILGPSVCFFVVLEVVCCGSFFMCAPFLELHFQHVKAYCSLIQAYIYIYIYA